MNSTDRYDGCFNRFSFQINKMGKYVSITIPIVEKLKDEDIMQFALEYILLRIVSFIEEFLGCIILIGGCWQEALLRSYFLDFGSDKAKTDVQGGCNLGSLIHYAKSEISFKNNAKKIERIFRHLFGLSPFPDQKTKDIILDMVLVRNIIIHEGGWPSEQHFRQVRTSGAIKISRTIKMSAGETSFYKLEITDKKFVLNAVMAVQSLMQHLNSGIRKAAS